MNPLHPTETKRLLACLKCDGVLRDIVRDLRRVGAKQAADYVARSRKSVQGAARHAQRLLNQARADR